MSNLDPSIDIYRQDREKFLSTVAFVDLIRIVLEKGADFRMKSKGMSMYPFICDGDIITISPIKIYQLKKGEIYAFPHPRKGKLIVHRYVGNKDGKLIIKGDYNPYYDPPILPGSILGKITKVERKKKELVPAPEFLRLCISFVSKNWIVRRSRFFFYKIILFFGDFY